jgi:O-Antigen ligase
MDPCRTKTHYRRFVASTLPSIRRRCPIGADFRATLAGVKLRALQWLVVAIAVGAAWGAVRYPGFLPVAWVAVMVGCLALPPAERRLLPVGWSLLALGVVGLAWTASLDHELALRFTLLFLLAGLVFGLARRASATDGQLAVLAAGVGLTSLAAVVQAAGGLARTQTLVWQLPAGLREAAATRLAGGRVFGTSALPGHFAVLLLTVVPLLVVLGGRRKGWRRAGLFAAAALSVAAIALTRSAAAVLLAGALLIVAARRDFRHRRLLALGAALVLAFGALTVLLRGDLANLEPVRLRWLNWRTSAWVFAHHPWLGVGLGGVGQAGLLAPTGAGNITPYTHGTWLQLLAELGIAGGGVLVAGTLALTRLLARGLREQPALAAAALVVPLHNLMDFSAYAPEVLLPWAVLAGTLAARILPLPRRRAPSWLLLPIVISGTLLAAAGWRSEVELAGASAGPGSHATAAALRAARWAPWSLTPVMAAAASALQAPPDPALLARISGDLSARRWVTPASAEWAAMRARLLLASGSSGEALVWAREARRRAPWRRDLDRLEETCAHAR